MLLAGALLAASALPAAARPTVHRRPLPGRVLAPFAAPADPFGPGHRGVDLAAAPGDSVAASAPGVVAFAGRVAGLRWVAVDHPGGLRTSYGPLAAVTVGAGERVAGGQPVGRASGRAHGKAGGLHWGARRDGRYVDPLSLVAGGYRPALVGPGGWWLRGRR